MKNIVTEILRINYSIGYDGEHLIAGGIYFSVGNRMHQYKITNLIDKHTVEYIVESVYSNEGWIPGNDNEIHIGKAQYFISYNIHSEHFSLFY